MELDLSELLAAAIRRGAHEECRRAIALGADVNGEIELREQGECYRTLPLHLAAMHGDATTCQMLLDAGAAVGMVDADGCTPLHVSANHGAYLVSKVLLEHGASVHVRDKMLRVPLHEAAGSGFLPVCELLVGAGASVHECDHSIRVPLHYAAMNDEADTCEFLIRSGANPENTCDADETPLHYAAERNCLSACRALVRLGARPSYKPKRVWSGYRTPFQTALKHSSFDVARYFVLECGENPDQKTVDGQTMDELVYRDDRPHWYAICTEAEVKRSLGEQIEGARAVQARSPKSPSVL